MKALVVIAAMSLAPAGCKDSSKSADSAKPAAQPAPVQDVAAAAPLAPTGPSDADMIAAFDQIRATAMFGPAVPNAGIELAGTVREFMARVTKAKALYQITIATCPMRDSKCVHAIACDGDPLVAKNPCLSSKLQAYVDVSATEPELVLATFTFMGTEEPVANHGDITAVFEDWDKEQLEDEIRAIEQMERDETRDAELDPPGSEDDEEAPIDD